MTRFNFGKLPKLDNGIGDAATADRLDKLCSASNPMTVKSSAGPIFVAHDGNGFVAAAENCTTAKAYTPGAAFKKLLALLETSHDETK